VGVPVGMKPPPRVENGGTSICALRFCRVSTMDRSPSGPKSKRLKEPGAAVRYAVLLRQPERHPLQIRLVGRAAAAGERALRALGVVLRAVLPGVVGHLVVVEDGDPRVSAVRECQIRVGLVQRVPQPVPGQVDGLGGGDAVPLADQLGRAVAVSAVAVLVHVSRPHAARSRRFVAFGERPVRGEVTARVVAARHQGEPQRVHAVAVVRRGPGLADDARLALAWKR